MTTDVKDADDAKDFAGHRWAEETRDWQISSRSTVTPEPEPNPDEDQVGIHE